MLDARAIRVLAHPLRSRVLSQLRRRPATATELAAALHTNTGATSYHLRKLESVGLVTDTGEGEGKRRLWRAARATTPGQLGVPRRRGRHDRSGWLERDYIRQFAARAEHWQDATELADRVGRRVRTERHLRHRQPGPDGRAERRAADALLAGSAPR